MILVLLLVLAVEARIFDSPSSPRDRAAFSVVVLLAILAGEVTALMVLQTGAPGTASSVIVWLAIGLGLLLATIRAFAGRVRLASSLDSTALRPRDRRNAQTAGTSCQGMGLAI
jgi:hypothetical protein